MRKFFWPLLKVNLRIQGLVWRVRGTAYFVPPKNTTILLTWRHSTSYERVAMLDAGDPFLEPAWVRRLETKQMFHIFHALQSEIPVSDTIVLQIRPLSQNYWFILMFEIIVYFILSLGHVFELEWISESSAYSAFFEFWQAQFRFVTYTECRRSSKNDGAKTDPCGMGLQKKDSAFEVLKQSLHTTYCDLAER